LTTHVTDYLEDQLQGSLKHEFEDHQIECEHCRTHLTQVRQTVGLLAALDAPAPVSETCHVRALNRFRDILGRAEDLDEPASEVAEHQWAHLVSMLATPQRLSVFDKLASQCGPRGCTCDAENPGNCAERFGEELEIDPARVSWHIEALSATDAFTKRRDNGRLHCSVDPTTVAFADRHRSTLVARLSA
jgi:hypothetical protein